jgi:hypothetical protein
MATPPIFVIGCPRSGTTLLSELLAKTRWGSPVETHFITKYQKRLHDYGDLSEFANFSHLVQDILKERPVMQWGMEVDIQAFYEQMPDFSFASICDQVVRQRKGKEWGDKTPHYITELKILTALFPESKYLYIVRDGRDVALSLLQKPWGPNNVHGCAHYWAACNQESEALSELRKRKQVYQLRYEDLLDTPQTVIAQVFDFLGEPPLSEADMAATCSPIKAGNYGKWQKRMTAEQIRLFETVCGDTLKRFGYDTSHPQGQVPSVEASLYEWADKALWAKHMVRENVIDTVKIKLLGKDPFGE